MISIENQGGGGNGEMSNGIMIGRGGSGLNELPTAYVTSTPLPMAKAHQIGHLPSYPLTHQNERIMKSEEEMRAEKNAIIASLFEEIRLEATLFDHETPGSTVELKTEEDGEDQPTSLTSTQGGAKKKLKKRKSELALEMTADDVDDILGDSASSNFNPKNPFGPSPPSISNGFADLGSPGSSSFSSKSSPPLSKYSQNNQGHRNSPPAQFSTMSPYMTPQMNSPLHSQLQQQTSSPPVAMHSPGQVPDFKQSIGMNALGMNQITPIPHPLHHHTRLLQHQQSAPNLRLSTPYDDLPQPHTLHPITTGNRPFDRSLVDEFEMCVRAVLMASQRVSCRHVYRQLTAEVSELYSRVAKNQVPKKAVKKIMAARTPATPSERLELERQFKCLADGLESRQSSQLYESILHFLYKMRVAIPDVSS